MHVSFYCFSTGQEAEGSARTDNISEAISRVYNRTLRKKGTKVEHVAAITRFTEHLFHVQMGYYDPKVNATQLSPLMVVRIER